MSCVSLVCVCGKVSGEVVSPLLFSTLEADALKELNVSKLASENEPKNLDGDERTPTRCCCCCCCCCSDPTATSVAAAAAVAAGDPARGCSLCLDFLTAATDEDDDVDDASFDCIPSIKRASIREAHTIVGRTERWVKMATLWRGV